MLCFICDRIDDAGGVAIGSALLSTLARQVQPTLLSLSLKINQLGEEAALTLLNVCLQARQVGV